MLASIIIILFAYLMGSISSAIVVCKSMRLPDPRTKGSRNPGATNVLRIGGKLPAALTLLGDVLKGVLPVLLARYLDFPSGVIALTAFFAVLGHLFPIFFRFEGGKGVATFLGALIALSPLTALFFCAVWLIVVFLCRYVALGSMTAAFFTPFFLVYVTDNYAYGDIAVLLASIIIIRHHGNIRNLIKGTEKKLGQK